MDIEWAIEQLEVFIEQTTPINASGNGVFTLTSHPQEPRHSVLAQWVPVKEILDVVYPEWETANLVDIHYEFAQRRDAAIQCVTKLVRKKEIAQRMGDAGPKLLGSQLHPWIWEAAKPLWRDAHFSSAVQVATTSLDSRLQDLLGRHDISGRELFNEAFSSNDAAPGKPRLRVASQLNNETTKNIQDGLRHLAFAAISLIRNVRSHTVEPITEVEGLEQLAVLSLLARQIGLCEVKFGEIDSAES